MKMNIKKEKCYISSTLTTHKDRANEIIGPCGPCSFINLVGLEGNFELEKELAEIGRMKPFYGSNFTSFLVWGGKYKKDLVIYTKNKSITKETFKMMFKYENIPKEKQEEMKKQSLERHSQIIEKNKEKIKLLTKSPLKTIDNLLEDNYNVAFMVSVKADDNAGENSPRIGHLRVCYKKNDRKYFIKDSFYGDLILSKNQMKKDLDKVKQDGFPQDIIGYKE